MKLICKLFVVLLFCSLSCGVWAQSSNYFECESDRADLILMHAPSDEIFWGVLHPYSALYEYYMDFEKLEREHDAYRKQLSDTGAEVVLVRDLLLKGCYDDNGEIIDGEALGELRELASKFLKYDVSNLPKEIADRQEEYRMSIINQATPKNLVSIILLQPTVKLYPTEHNTGLSATYSANPIMNLYFMRDQMITTPRGVVLGRMNSTQRSAEVDIAEFCLRRLGVDVIHKVSGEGSYLEGGDYMMFNGVSYIGCGMRTTQSAIDTLMARDAFGSDKVVVVKDRRFYQAQMHLDTYFNIIDRDLVTLASERMTQDDSSKNYLVADIYVRRKGGYKLQRSNVSFVKMLRRDGVDIIEIGQVDQDNMANNFLTVGARHIFAVSGQSEALKETFRRYGVTVEWIPLDELKKGYGAAHCMTQVLHRSVTKVAR